MPQGETFWNPYRWVAVSDRAVQRDEPHFHHSVSGLSGRLWCELGALTPLLVGDGKGEFVRHGRNGPPYIPATSLKGAIRFLAEVVGNAAVPFSKVSVDDQHQLAKARIGSQLDTTARTFGYLDGGKVFAGLIRFSDAEITGELQPSNQWQQYEVAIGQPKPSHGAFYPGKNQRKFYHHHPGATQLTPPHPGITQTVKVGPAPPATRFRFRVDFENLRDSELNLLLYCLVLEEQATVELSPTALGRSVDRGGLTLCGPLRHKLGGAKPHGAGSIQIRVTQQVLTEPTSRYRGNAGVDVWKSKRLTDELARRTASFRERGDRTMRELRAMLIYDSRDPRQPVRYPTYEWFSQNSQTPLKPTT